MYTSIPRTLQINGIQSGNVIWTIPSFANLLYTEASMKNQNPKENYIDTYISAQARATLMGRGRVELNRPELQRCRRRLFSRLPRREAQAAGCSRCERDWT